MCLDQSGLLKFESQHVSTRVSNVVPSSGSAINTRVPRGAPSETGCEFIQDVGSWKMKTSGGDSNPGV